MDEGSSHEIDATVMRAEILVAFMLCGLSGFIAGMATTLLLV